MRQLSQQLVAAQEEERKNLSRELHDHVGAGADRAAHGARPHRAACASAGDAASPAAVAECRQLVDSMFRTVRDLALGLRPSMLDDFGLQPALEWHVRDFTRRYGVPVELTIDGDFDAPAGPASHLRLSRVQEALTNCVRHAQAAHDRGDRQPASRRLDVSVTDDGVGLDPARRAQRPRPARHRGARQGARRHDDHRQRDQARARRWRCSCRCRRDRGGGAACACCWLTITASCGAGCAACSREPASTVVAEAADGLEAVRLCEEHRPTC